MKRSTFSPTQIAGILKDFDNGKGIDELTRVHGISRATLYKWRQRYGGMDASEMKRMYANLAMELDVAKYIIEKSSKALREKDHHRCRPPRAAKDIGKACRLLRLSRSSQYYASVKKNTPPKVFVSATTVCAIRARP